MKTKLGMKKKKRNMRSNERKKDDVDEKEKK